MDSNPTVATGRHPAGLYLVTTGYGTEGEHVDVALKPGRALNGRGFTHWVFFGVLVAAGAAWPLWNDRYPLVGAFVFAGAVVFILTGGFRKDRTVGMPAGRVATFTIPEDPPPTVFETVIHDSLSRPEQDTWVDLSGLAEDVATLLEATTSAAAARANKQEASLERFLQRLATRTVPAVDRVAGLVGDRKESA